MKAASISLPLITDEVPFEDAPALFARLDAGDAGILQSVLTFAQRH